MMPTDRLMLMPALENLRMVIPGATRAAGSRPSCRYSRPLGTSSCTWTRTSWRRCSAGRPCRRRRRGSSRSCAAARGWSCRTPATLAPPLRQTLRPRTRHLLPSPRPPRRRRLRPLLPHSLRRPLWELPSSTPPSRTSWNSHPPLPAICGVLPSRTGSPALSGRLGTRSPRRSGRAPGTLCTRASIAPRLLRGTRSLPPSSTCPPSAGTAPLR
mmetsp:Transcript_127175/g.354123  ORF Transcript_127175/g.354123 Transcript_127175/m.354123 type:complete len:213 (-) Transcript_127175:1368-2006(-)